MSPRWGWQLSTIAQLEVFATPVWCRDINLDCRLTNMCMHCDGSLALTVHICSCNKSWSSNLLHIMLYRTPSSKSHIFSTTDFKIYRFNYCSYIDLLLCRSVRMRIINTVQVQIFNSEIDRILICTVIVV